VVQQQNIATAENQLVRLLEFEERENAMVESGRQERFQSALVAQDVLFARDRLQTLQESYRFAVDQFKVRLGIAVDEEVVIVPSILGLPTPDVDLEEAVRAALAYRLDLQNRRDQLSDARRSVEVARNAILPDLNVRGSIGIPSDDERDWPGLRLNAEDLDFVAGVTLGLPLDREIERLQLRQSQIALERSIREYERFRDSIVVEVRDAARQIGRALFSIRLQEENVRIAQMRLESIEAAPGRATARDRSEATDDLAEAQNELDQAVRDLQVAILEYLQNTGMLRVTPTGDVQALAGMAVERPEPQVPGAPPNPPGGLPQPP
jgi:outer membrane protein TolC